MARSVADAARLEAIAAAKKLHHALDLPKRVVEAGGLVDVFESIAELNIQLVFKPLDSALGLCLPKPLRGIMVTTRRGLHIQRFTAAHELGHVILDHQGSIDREILERGPLAPSRGRNIQEVQADAFAAEFLLPRWLYRHHVRSQGWSIGNLRNPKIVYQLSLRMGASYDATCWGLLGHQILPRGDVDALRTSKVAELKSELGEEFRPGNSWANVWRITDKDSGGTITGNPDDLIRLELNEASGSGFQWDVAQLRDAGYQVLSDSSSFAKDPLRYGAPTHRTLIARPPAEGDHVLALTESQPWRPSQPDDPKFSVQLSLHGPEAGGLSRADRKRRSHIAW